MGVSHAERGRRVLIAALFGVHPKNTAGGNLGSSMAGVVRVRGLTPSLERRFVALLEADGDDLAGHLRRAVSLTRSADIPLNWAQLLADVIPVKLKGEMR